MSATVFQLAYLDTSAVRRAIDALEVGRMKEISEKSGVPFAISESVLVELAQQPDRIRNISFLEELNPIFLNCNGSSVELSRSQSSPADRFDRLNRDNLDKAVDSLTNTALAPILTHGLVDYSQFALSASKFSKAEEYFKEMKKVQEHFLKNKMSLKSRSDIETGLRKCGVPSEGIELLLKPLKSPWTVEKLRNAQVMFTLLGIYINGKTLRKDPQKFARSEIRDFNHLIYAFHCSILFTADKGLAQRASFLSKNYKTGLQVFLFSKRG